MFSIQNITNRSLLAEFAQKLAIRKMANFGQNPWTNPYWKISIFWIFSRISKTMFPGSICRKTTIEKDGHFLAKNHGIHLLKNILFLYFFKVHYCLKSILLYPEYQINDVSLLDMPKTRHSKKWPFLAKNYRLTPLEKFWFLGIFFFGKLAFLV